MIAISPTPACRDADSGHSKQHAKTAAGGDGQALRLRRVGLFLAQNRERDRPVIWGRLIGWIVFLAGGAVLVRDVIVWINTGIWSPIALGQLWYELNRSSLNMTQAVTQRYIHPFLWDPIIVSILLCWAFAVLMTLGLLILVIFSRRGER
jgi:hypothetical protein